MSSLFNLKDLGGGDDQNDFDSNQFFSHTGDSSFSNDNNHQNGFGLGYGGNPISASAIFLSDVYLGQNLNMPGTQRQLSNTNASLVS
jgi:hypothetical protein